MMKLLSSWRQLAAVSSIALLSACTAQAVHQSQGNYAPTERSVRMMATNSGTVLATPDGRTLYTYDRDDNGRSNCYGECADYWPPYLGNSDSQPYGRLTLVSRRDGQIQWASGGMPLYTFVEDQSPGEVNGDDYHHDWHVVR